MDHLATEPAAQPAAKRQRKAKEVVIVVGTYSEKLGHVDGKGAGLYVLRLDREKLSVVPDEAAFGKAQLGGAQPNGSVEWNQWRSLGGETRLFSC